MMKNCSTCGELQPATSEYFYKCEHTKSGLRAQCKKCHKQYDKAKRKEYNNQYYHANKELFKKYNETYRKKKAIAQYINNGV
ncbi:hypothetical protein ACN077_20840 [Clostridium chromiireducens]|uniref:hypothetical protein n=1 Tax=Clostridium chromiireducens TaxID=225345 RepID=UPI003AF5245C